MRDLPETLPASLTDQEFWAMITDHSKQMSGGVVEYLEIIRDSSSLKKTKPEFVTLLRRSPTRVPI
jgi:hypothetical protein